MLLMLTVQYASASWVLVPDGGFESGTVGLIPDNWVMITKNFGPEAATYVHEMKQTDQKYFEGSRSLWLHSRVVDTDGTKTSRDCYTIAETEDWINASSATQLRIYMRDIKSTHSPLGWGWGNSIFLSINNVSVVDVSGPSADWVFTNGEFINWNLYNYTAIGSDGQSWYVYEYGIPESIDKTHMKIQISCDAGDWTFYSTSYFSDLEFFVDKVELLELIPNGSFEEGTLCTVPDYWVMKTFNYTSSPPPISTYIHEVCENDTHYFSGSRSCWLHSRVVDTDGTKRDRYSWTWIESADWINQPSATHVRFYIRDIQPSHSLYWGWNDGIYLGFNDTVWDITNYRVHIYNNGETVNFNHYNSTKIGEDGATWYEYIYPIPSFINKSQMRIQLMCIAGDWTFYDTSYFADMSFYVDDVDFLCQSTPSVSISPSAASIYVGESVSFTSVVSGGTLPYSYQWCLNGNPVSGATSSTWTFTPVTTGTYTVYLNVTENLGGIAKSNEASVTVAPQLTASISPTSASVLVGQSVAFTSTVSGGYTPYSYQWYLNDNPVSGATANTWAFVPTTTGSYIVYMNVTDKMGNIAKSNEASVTVAAQLTASISPMSASVLVGQPVAFTSTVSGGYTPYSYQWYLNGAPVSGATSSNWAFTPIASGIHYVYLKVTDAKGNTAQSETARITVATAPVGGYSFPMERSTKADPLTLYLTVAVVSAIIFPVIKRKVTRKTKSSSKSFS